MSRYFKWFILCNVCFILSIFLHECIHGIQSFLSGYSVSTGFNKVGNPYKFPRDADFRLNYSNDPGIDAAVLFNLIVAILFTILFCKLQRMSARIAMIILAIAVCNSILRLIPSILSIILPLFGTAHVEDEISVGWVWESATGIPYLTYLPAVISMVVSIGCLLALYRRCRKRYPTELNRTSINTIWLALVSSFFLASCLDQVIRFNWIA